MAIRIRCALALFWIALVPRPSRDDNPHSNTPARGQARSMGLPLPAIARCPARPSAPQKHYFLYSYNRNRIVREELALSARSTCVGLSSRGPSNGSAGLWRTYAERQRILSD